MKRSDGRRMLYLASASPRRAELLRRAGYRFERLAPRFDESSFDIGSLPPARAAIELAERKAACGAEHLRCGVVIGCDTLVSVDGQPIGKPLNMEEARRTLHRLIGRVHEVVSGVCLIDAADPRKRSFVDTATVRIGPIPPGELERYLASGDWRGKAGGYNLDELRGRWPIEVGGDPTTVIGLPMRRLREALSRFAADLLPEMEPPP